jgi:hypothetical protein
MYRVFQKELYNGIANVTVWRVLRKRLHLKAYKLSIMQDVVQWVVCTPLSINVFVKIATQQHLEYDCKTLFETPCIPNGSHIEPKLSQIKLGVF